MKDSLAFVMGKVVIPILVSVSADCIVYWLLYK